MTFRRGGAALLLSGLLTGCPILSLSDLEKEMRSTCDGTHPCASGWRCGTDGFCAPMTTGACNDGDTQLCGMTGGEYRALANYERKPLLDKAMSGLYPPGSTFKPTVALAALEAGVDPEQRVNCSGGWYYGGRTWRCWGWARCS